MDNDEPSQVAGTNAARSMLSEGNEALRDILDAFGVMASRMRNGEDVTQAELSKALIALSQARTRLINEVKEHEDTVLFAEGRHAEAPLDLDALRVKIGRRIDRIRDAIDEEKLS